MNTHITALVAFAALLGGGGAAPAQPAPQMPGMPMPAQPADAPASMMAGMDRMMKDMAAVPMTGNADQEFVGMMMPHHQGAIDMARYELAHGTDPELLALARGIVAAQETEIAQMKAWQEKHPAGR